MNNEILKRTVTNEHSKVANSVEQPPCKKSKHHPKCLKTVGINHKKSFFYVSFALIFFALMFNSCKKEGIYQPDKRISKIYYSYVRAGQEYPKTLQETWIWGKKNLEKIVTPSGGEQKFYYNSQNQVTRIDLSPTVYIKVNYRYSKLSVALVYLNNEKVAEYAFSHEDGKISRVTLKNSLPVEDIALAPLVQEKMLGLLMPQPIAQRVAQTINQSETTDKYRKSDDYVYTIDIKWNGDNIEKYIITNSGVAPGYAVICEYDNYLNPYCKFSIDYKGVVVAAPIGGVELLFCTSKNNVLNVSYDYGGETFDQTYSYKYDGQYPIEQTYSVGEGRNITYFEYED
ncbi:MAG: hypothetical protein LBR36_04825 [Bacteroidales bacterium]|jgi:hypothetical protein|nr:hypothetical protein [Bacteroidales bacterium]